MNRIIYAGDCFEYMKTMADNSVQLVLSDIPYNCVNGYKEGGLRKINRPQADREPDGSLFDARKYVRECMRICSGAVFIFCGHPQIPEIIDEMEKAGGKQVRLFIWEKTNPSPINGQYFYLNSIEHAVCCRQKGMVFNRPCAHPVMITKTTPNKELHETVKPQALLRQIISDCTRVGDTVFDGTAGSLSTAVAAIGLDRGYIVVEKDKDMVDKAMAFHGDRLWMKE